MELTAINVVLVSAAVSSGVTLLGTLVTPWVTRRVRAADIAYERREEARAAVVETSSFASAIVPSSSTGTGILLREQVEEGREASRLLGQVARLDRSEDVRRSAVVLGGAVATLRVSIVDLLHKMKAADEEDAALAWEAAEAARSSVLEELDRFAELVR